MFLIGRPSFSTNNVAYPDPPPFQEANMCPVFPVSNNSKMFPQCAREGGNLSLDVNQSTVLGEESPEGVQQQLRLHADVDLHRLPRCLHPEA